MDVYITILLPAGLWAAEFVLVQAIEVIRTVMMMSKYSDFFMFFSCF